MSHEWLVVLVGALGVLGCSKTSYALVEPESPPPDDPIPAEPPATLACDYCVGTAPATFTGPSNFFRGRLELAPDCKAPTPLMGIEGFLTSPTRHVQFVRECRITPTDTCAVEGKVCAPLPDEDFQTCVHHTGDVACPVEYSAHRETILTAGPEPLLWTLCCMSAPGPA